MAAYAALVSLAGLIDQILPRDQDYAFICNKEQMVSLHQKTIRLQEFLEYDSTIRVSSVVVVLESRIRDAAYQLENIIDSIICSEPANTSCLLLSVISCICGNRGEAESHSRDAAEFFSCIAEIDIILEEAKMQKYQSAAHSSTTSSSRAAPTAEVINVGLDNACTQMLNTITGQTSSLQKIPITGMGGIGKTTLASAVYNHSRSLHHFDVRLWVTISQDYDIQEVLRGLLSTVKQNEQPDGSLLERVYKYLKGRRFLVVLDDMWHKKAWDGVMNAFPDDKKGSCIILTTRQLGVASYVGSLNNVQKIQLLDEDQSWVMLRETVYGVQPCPAELIDTGRTISKNCKGLPLAIVVIAGILKSNQKKDHWEKVARNTKATASTDYDQLFGILSLSYTNLPPQLKACFLHVGAFPEDYEFQVEELVMLWTAEGFIKPRESQTMEDMAEECIEELVERNLILVKKKTYNGKIKTFSIHDVLREVSMKKAREEKFLQQNSTSTVQNIRNGWYNVSSLKNDLNFDSGTYNAHLRSFKYTFLNPNGSKWGARYSVLLRMMNIKYPTPPLSVLCKTTGLRYLYICHAINHDLHITFPKSISILQNLETFIIRTDYGGSSTIPLSIWKLQRLRHIVVDGSCNLQFPAANERGYPILENLQTVIGVINANLSMDVIERIPNVKRMILIYKNTLLNENHPGFSLKNLQQLHQLEELSIENGYTLSDLVFPRNLKKLNLYFTYFPSMTNIGSLPYLEVLKLTRWSFVNDIWEPVEGEFLQLKYLKVDFLRIRKWRVESSHFPCLQKLEIIGCGLLEEVPESVGEIDTLEELVLKDCRLAKESVQKIQEIQQELSNDLLKITIIGRN